MTLKKNLVKLALCGALLAFPLASSSFSETQEKAPLSQDIRAKVKDVQGPVRYEKLNKQGFKLYECIKDYLIENGDAVFSSTIDPADDQGGYKEIICYRINKKNGGRLEYYVKDNPLTKFNKHFPKGVIIYIKENPESVLGPILFIPSDNDVRMHMVVDDLKQIVNELEIKCDCED